MNELSCDLFVFNSMGDVLSSAFNLIDDEFTL